MQQVFPFSAQSHRTHAACLHRVSPGVDLMQVIATKPNVCKQLHMPAQSGSSSMLERMRRGYTRQAYDDLVQHARQVIPGVALSTDIISGEYQNKPVWRELTSLHIPEPDMMAKHMYIFC